MRRKRIDKDEYDHGLLAGYVHREYIIKPITSSLEKTEKSLKIRDKKRFHKTII